MVIKLSQATEKQNYKIVSVLGSDKLSIRLKELGFVKNTKLFITNFSMAKKCAIVCIRGYHLCLKNNALAKVLVTNA